MNAEKIRLIIVGVVGSIFASTAVYFFRFRFGLQQTMIVSLIVFYLLAWLFGFLKKPKAN